MPPPSATAAARRSCDTGFAITSARFTARREELKEFLPPKLQGYVDRGEPLPEPEYGDARGR